MKPLLTIALNIILTFNAIGQKVNPRFDWFDKPDTKNDSVNLKKLKIKSITVEDVLVMDRYDETVWKRVIRRFDSLGNPLPDSAQYTGLHWDVVFKYNKAGNPVKMEVLEAQNHIHNEAVFKYDSKGNITDMKAKIFGPRYETDYTTAHYLYDDKTGLLKNVWLGWSKGSLSYTDMKYSYEFYK